MPEQIIDTPMPFTYTGLQYSFPKPEGEAYKDLKALRSFTHAA